MWEVQHAPPRDDRPGEKTVRGVKYRSEACGVAGPVIAHMCRDKGQATMDAIKIRTSKDKDKDKDVHCNM